MLDGLAGCGGGGLAGNRHGAHARGVQVAFDGGLAVAAGRRGRRQLRAVGGGTVLDGLPFTRRLLCLLSYTGVRP